jgi:hypothetical protein
MNVATWCRLFVLLSLVTLPDFVAIPSLVYSQSGGGSGSGGSSPGGSQAGPTKPRGSKTSPSMSNMQPSDTPKQAEGPRAPAQMLEERLRSGQMDQPIAQDQISNRLEQLHGGSVERPTGNAATNPSTK